MGFISREVAAHVLIPLGIGASLAIFLLSALAARALVLRLPANFLETPRAAISAPRAALRAVVGAALVGVGIALLALPGPGVMFIVIGALMLAPSRHSRIVRAVLARPRVLLQINAFRRRHRCAELQIPRSDRD